MTVASPQVTLTYPVCPCKPAQPIALQPCTHMYVHIQPVGQALQYQHRNVTKQLTVGYWQGDADRANAIHGPQSELRGRDETPQGVRDPADSHQNQPKVTSRHRQTDPLLTEDSRKLSTCIDNTNSVHLTVCVQR
jgi:hypothetical protein